MSDLHRTLWAACVAQGHSLGYVGRESNLSTKHVSLIMRGQATPSLPALVALCRALDLDPATVAHADLDRRLKEIA